MDCPPVRSISSTIHAFNLKALSMINPFKTMANLMKKFKRKRRLSSELHARWGDPSISYPNEGSWNQWNQPSGSVANATAGTSRGTHSDDSRCYLAVGTMSSQNAGILNDRGSQRPTAYDSTQVTSAIPKGYFDDRIRHHSKRAYSPHVQGLGIDGNPQGMSNGHDATADDESCDEEDEERDILGDPEGGESGGGSAMAYHAYTTGDMSRNPVRDDQDSYVDRSSRSPPLSVTSRMRRISVQSATTEHSSSVTGTASSRHTSYTAASSISAPSLPPDTPRYAFNGIHPIHSEKRPVPRPRYREPEPAVRHELVPSYDELYG